MVDLGLQNSENQEVVKIAMTPTMIMNCFCIVGPPIYHFIYICGDLEHINRTILFKISDSIFL